MDFPIDPDDHAESEEPSFVEQTLLGAVRLASLPFLGLAISLAALTYGVGSLIRHAATLVAGLRHPRGSARIWDRSIEARDA